MKEFRRRLLPDLLLLLLLSPLTLPAASILPSSESDKLFAADAAAVAELIALQSRAPEGRITTDFVFRTAEPLRGNFPPYFKVTADGGVYGYRADANSLLPNLSTGSEYLLFLDIEAGRLTFRDGPAGTIPVESAGIEALRTQATGLGEGVDLSAFATGAVSVSDVVTASGLLDTDGFRRFTLQDQGVPIPVYADVSTRPAGITEQQALDALQDALDAWEAVTSLRFSIEGTEVFTQPANSYSETDGLVIRVQMHDTFNQISDASNTLGRGGAGFNLDLGGGATVDGDAFNPITYGYVTMNHPKASLSDPVTLEEVLTHEIGHVIGMAHSSETFPEPDTTKAEALMYYLAHTDGRGASLNSYDTTTILQAYPLDTPPYAFDRVLYAVTSNSLSLSYPEVNQVTLAGGDLQGQALSVQQESASSGNGTFSLTGNVLSYNPYAAYSDADSGDPAGSWFDRFRARVSDGTHLSPYIEVRVVGFRRDTYPLGTQDGVPDSWMTTYYGSASGSTAGADTDGDGLDSKAEFLLGTDPTDSDSRLKIVSFSSGSLEWTSQRFDVYRIQSTTDFSTWTTERLVTEESGAATLSASGLPEVAPGGDLFLRVDRVD